MWLRMRFPLPVNFTGSGNIDLEVEERARTIRPHQSTYDRPKPLSMK